MANRTGGGENRVAGWLSSFLDRHMGNVKSPRWQQVLDMVTEPWVPGNYYQGSEGRWSTTGEVLESLNPLQGLFDAIRSGQRSPAGGPLPGYLTGASNSGWTGQQQGPWYTNTPQIGPDASGNWQQPSFPWEQVNQYLDAIEQGPPTSGAGSGSYGVNRSDGFGYTPRGPAGGGGGLMSPSAQTVATGAAAVALADALGAGQRGIYAKGDGLKLLQKAMK